MLHQSLKIVACGLLCRRRIAGGLLPTQLQASQRQHLPWIHPFWAGRDTPPTVGATERPGFGFWRSHQCGVIPGLCRPPAPDQYEQLSGRTAAWDRLPHRSRTWYSGLKCLAFRVPDTRERLPFARYAPLPCSMRRGYYALALLVNFSVRQSSHNVQRACG